MNFGRMQALAMAVGDCLDSGIRMHWSVFPGCQRCLIGKALLVRDIFPFD